MSGVQTLGDVTGFTLLWTLTLLRISVPMVSSVTDLGDQAAEADAELAMTMRNGTWKKTFSVIVTPPRRRRGWV